MCDRTYRGSFFVVVPVSLAPVHLKTENKVNYWVNVHCGVVVSEVAMCSSCNMARSMAG